MIYLLCANSHSHEICEMSTARMDMRHWKIDKIPSISRIFLIIKYICVSSRYGGGGPGVAYFAYLLLV